MAGNVFIAVYRPHPGKEEELVALVKGHAPMLKSEGLITDHPVVVLKAEGGAVIEIAEWAGNYDDLAPYSNPKVAATWDAMMKVADFCGLKGLKEIEKQFPHFEPLDL